MKKYLLYLISSVTAFPAQSYTGESSSTTKVSEYMPKVPFPEPSLQKTFREGGKPLPDYKKHSEKEENPFPSFL